MLPQLTLDNAAVTSHLVDFLRRETRRIGIGNAVLGLSGGVDSAMVAYLAAEALGPERVLCVMMPYRTSSVESLEHAALVVDALGVRSEKVEITDMVEPLFASEPGMDRLRRGNIMARERMIVLYDRSSRDAALVFGTGNKTEILLGYSTLYGDSACAINPVGDLYKTQVWSLARHLGVPEVIVNKSPSADLWVGQTDEGELGFSYESVDGLLYFMMDEGLDDAELEARGYDGRFVHDVRERIRRNEFKSLPPVVARLGNG